MESDEAIVNRINAFLEAQADNRIAFVTVSCAYDHHPLFRAEVRECR